MDLTSKVGEVASLTRKLNGWQGSGKHNLKQKKNCEAKLRNAKRSLLECVVTHRKLCGDTNCLCNSLEAFVPPEMTKVMPDLRQKGALVVFHSDHTDECKQSWSREDGRAYCHHACAGLQAARNTQKPLLASVSLQSSTTSVPDTLHEPTFAAAATQPVADGARNDCGCPSAATIRFGVAQNQGFTHKPGNDPRENLKDVIEYLMSGLRGQKRKDTVGQSH
jgi:hypothetical protein